MANGNAAAQPLPLELGWPSYQQNTVDRWRGELHERKQDYIAEEVPISLVYNGLPHVVMLASPTDLEEFALGFSITKASLKIRKNYYQRGFITLQWHRSTVKNSRSPFSMSGR